MVLTHSDVYTNVTDGTRVQKHDKNHRYTGFVDGSVTDNDVNFYGTILLGIFVTVFLKVLIKVRIRRNNVVDKDNVMNFVVLPEIVFLILFLSQLGVCYYTFPADFYKKVCRSTKMKPF